MSNCASNLGLVAEPALADFDRRLASLDVDRCSEFFQEARQLDSQLLCIYRMAVVCARGAEDLAEVVAVWAMMGRICDKACQRLHALHKRHPSCGADFYYNRILDMRNKCRHLETMHR